MRQKWFNEYYTDGQGKSLPVDFSFDQWPAMKLPCSWNTFSKEYLLYEGVMVFTRKFSCDLSSLKNKKVFLKVGAINYTARLFLNKAYIGKFYPEQGDIVLYSGKKLLVLSNYDVNKKYSFFVGIDVVEDMAEGIEIKGEKNSYVGLVQTFSSYAYNRKCPVVVDKINSGIFF